MIEITLSIDKAKVYNEVAKTTSYTGSKMKGDDTAYDRIFTTDSDKAMLDRFWDEASSEATDCMKKFLIENQSDNDTFKVKLEVSSSFEENLLPTIVVSLNSFFTLYITENWFVFTNKSDTENYSMDAKGKMKDVINKLYFKKRPKRVKPI